MAFPKLYGAPAYARAPRGAPVTERPFDPDDLPIVAQQTDEERAVAAGGPAPAAPASNGHAPTGGEGNGAAGGMTHFSLRGLRGRMGRRDR